MNTNDLFAAATYGTLKQMNKPISEEIAEALQKKVCKGIDEIARVRAHNPEAVYNGEAVGAKDKDKVLLRWKLDDGRYETIFGDLRVETVTAERLHALKGK